MTIDGKSKNTDSIFYKWNMDYIYISGYENSICTKIPIYELKRLKEQKSNKKISGKISLKVNYNLVENILDIHSVKCRYLRIGDTSDLPNVYYSL